MEHAAAPDPDQPTRGRRATRRRVVIPAHVERWTHFTEGIDDAGIADELAVALTASVGCRVPTEASS